MGLPILASRGVAAGAGRAGGRRGRSSRAPRRCSGAWGKTVTRRGRQETWNRAA